MRFATAYHNNTAVAGVVDGAHWFSLGTSLRAALEQGLDLQALGAQAIAQGQAIAFATLQLAPVVPDPVSIICLGLNYQEHAKEGGRPPPEYPWFFMRSARSLVAAEQAMVVPRASSHVDYEAEMAVVIGKKVPRHTPREQALDYVWGYSAFNDVSIRDYQRRTPQWTIGKNFDATGAFGPVVVTADELPAGGKNLRIQGRLNGQIVQDANTSDMIFPVDQTIALLSECMTLDAGDVIVMGTPSGVGQSRDPQLWLQAGDEFVVEIEGIGALRNPLVAE